MKMVTQVTFSNSGSAANRYRVPQKVWKRWSVSARKVFNEVYENMRDQSNIVHPKTAPLKREQWRTLQWNAAWLAAAAVGHV